MNEVKKIGAYADVVESYITALYVHRKPDLYKLIPERFINDEDFGRELIKQVFWRNDPDITPESFVWLPEYEKVLQWMMNTRGKGLLLMGNNGTGKSIILKWLIPVLMKMIEKVGTPVSCYDLHKIYDSNRVQGPKTLDDKEMTYFDRCRQWRYILLDEVGVESSILVSGSYNNTFNPVEVLINIAEDENKALFATTNLDDDKIEKRYGVRSFDRLIKKTVIIKFESNSQRK